MAYPTAIKSFPTLVDGVDSVLALHQNERAIEIVAIETELGLSPSGSYSDVAARLDGLDSDIATVEATAASNLTAAILDHEYGANLVYDGAAAYHIEAGARQVQGVLLTWSGNILRFGLTVAASTLYNIYLYDSSGNAAVEESTTAPVWNSTYRYWEKTGDATRRWIGYYISNSAGNIVKWLAIMSGRRTVEYYYIDGDESPHALVTSVVSATNWTSVSLSLHVPLPANHWYALAKLTFTTANAIVLGAVSPVDLGSSSPAAAGVYTVRNDNSIAGSRTFFGRTFIPIGVAQTTYYKTAITGTGDLSLLCWGCKYDI